MVKSVHNSKPAKDEDIRRFILDCFARGSSGNMHLYHEIKTAFPSASAEQIGRCANKLLSDYEAKYKLNEKGGVMC